MLRLFFLPFPSPGAGNSRQPEGFLCKDQLARLGLRAGRSKGAGLGVELVGAGCPGRPRLAL